MTARRPRGTPSLRPPLTMLAKRERLSMANDNLITRAEAA